ncbi:SHOCT domain-containing protein [Nocardioides zhouii]|uniref:SHOCT domain-containing protein n=2 Tax=Nocardioides zhouii TaxID=1168729 RepID=A0A4Q2SIM8_9ACTN|nr:SHOCT domain-containing protein [Nocardioides zhouii]
MMGWYNNGGMDTGNWIAMILMMSLFWGAVIFAGIMIFRGTTNSRGDRNSAPTNQTAHRDPMDILNERFARGELENEEYEARKAVLLGTKR